MREALALAHPQSLGLDATRVAELVERLDDPHARATTEAERIFLAQMGGGCQVPIGAFARIAGEDPIMTITGMVAGLDGKRLLRRSLSGTFTGIDSAVKLGRRLVEEIFAAGAQEILDEVYKQSPVLPEQSS